MQEASGRYLITELRVWKPRSKQTKDVHGYVMDGVNCDTVSYLVYNSPHSQRFGCGYGPNPSITVLSCIILYIRWQAKLVPITPSEIVEMFQINYMLWTKSELWLDIWIEKWISYPHFWTRLYYESISFISIYNPFLSFQNISKQLSKCAYKK